MGGGSDWYMSVVTRPHFLFRRLTYMYMHAKLPVNYGKRRFVLIYEFIRRLYMYMYNVLDAIV